MTQELQEPKPNAASPQPPVDHDQSSQQNQASGSTETNFRGSVDPASSFTNGGFTDMPRGQDPVVVMAPQKKSRGWVVGIVAIVAIFLLCLFGMWSCSSALSGVASSSDDNLAYLSGDTIAVISIDGTIQYDGTTSSPEGLKEQLDKAAENDNIKAVVLRVNSGGGVATAGEEMSTYVREFMDETSKPVVVSSAATNASAAYEISSQADYIFVAKSTAIGSIGTAMQFIDYSGLMELLGISTEDVTSSSGKNSTYGTRSLTDEEREYYQAQVDQINETFIETVAEGRDMTIEEVTELATGLTYTGLDAIENGLADEVGTLEDALDKAAELAGCSSYYDTVELETYSSSDLNTLLDLLSESNGGITTDDFVSALKELESDGSIEQ